MHSIPAADVAAPNPWKTMWLSPRITMRRLLDAKVRPSWVRVVALAAVSFALSSLQLDDTGALSASRSAMPVVMGMAQLVFGVLVGPFLLAFVCGWLGGDADPEDIREAIAWSYVPIAAGLVLWVPLLLVGGAGVFARQSGPESELPWLAVVLLLGLSGSYLWSVPLMIGALAEAQRISIGKAILSLVILSIPLFVLSAIG